uniref:Long-chain-fatty-acid--CoA ligase n=1 Tax=Anas zonorhyncha TaxID=75864 RepID=A0A8B9VNQ1_9AVES
MVALGGPDNGALGYWEYWGLGTGGIQGMGAPKRPGDGGTGSTWVPELRAPGVPVGWEHREAGSTGRRGTKRWGHPGYREDWGNRDTGITGGGSTRGTGILRYQSGTRIPEIKAVGVFRRWEHWELMPPAGGGPQLLPHQDRLWGCVGGDWSHAQGLPPPHPTPPSPDLFPMVEPILPSLQEEDGIVVWVLGAGPYPPGVVALQELLDEASEELEPEDVWQPEDMNDTCLYIFTSGTTGLPKAARISHLKSIMCLSFYELVGASSRDVVYLALPLYHMAGSLLGIVGCIGIGATCVLKEKFSASQFWDDCRAEGVTVFQYIGELCRYLVNQPQRPGERQHGLRLAVGSGLRPDVWRRFLERFGAIRIVETYGLTEGNVTLFNYTGTPGAVGRSSFIYKLFSPFEIVRYDVAEGAPVRDKAGRCIPPVPAGETGLLIAPVTPRTPFLGYAGSQELSEQKLLRGVFAEGDTYFSTGDLMEQDAAQFVRFRDRTGDTYRWKGENVATTEVAEVLAAHEALQEVTVYGVSVPGSQTSLPRLSPPSPTPCWAGGTHGRAPRPTLTLGLNSGGFAPKKKAGWATHPPPAAPMHHSSRIQSYKSFLSLLNIACK